MFRNDAGKISVWRVLTGIVVLVGFGVLAFLLIKCNNRSTPNPVATPHVEAADLATPTSTPMPTPTATAVPESISNPQECTGWARGETKMLEPGQTVLGDVVAAWTGWDEVMVAYDNGQSGEGTAVINSSSHSISVHSPWGAGCLVTTDKTSLVDQELAGGCGDPGGCKTVRVVILTDAGTSVEFYPTP